MSAINYERPFHKHLRRGETLLWVGRPRQGIWFRQADWALAPFGLLWGGMALMIEATSLGLRGRSGYNPCVAVIGLPFAYIGLYIAVGRFFIDARQRRRTWYAVTNRRALILYYGNLVCLNGVDLSEPVKLVRENYPDGTGTLVFETPKLDPYWEAREGRSGFLDFGRPSFPAFEGIEQVGEVQRLIQEAMPPRYEKTVHDLETMTGGGAWECNEVRQNPDGFRVQE